MNEFMDKNHTFMNECSTQNYTFMNEYLSMEHKKESWTH